MKNILIVEDEDKLRRVLELQLGAGGYQVLQAATAEEGLKLADQASLVLTDLKLPGMDGLELLAALRRQDSATPVIVMTAFGTVEKAVDAMKAGAADFLAKPVDAAALVQAVRAALKTAQARHQTIIAAAEMANRLATLTAREREVMEQVVAGKPNKQIAAELGTGEQNIKLHRAHIMKKMGVRSLADLVRVAERLRG